MAIKASNQITFTEHRKIIEIKEYYLATTENSGVTIETNGWTTNIQTIDYNKKYLWNYEEVVYSIGESEISDPVIIGFYGKGDTGKGITNIINFYVLTETPELPTTPKWSADTSVVTGLTPTNKYLWNKETIQYTDGTSTDTAPAIIGVYGDSGTDAITFEIYSPHGFQFKEDLQAIELNIAAFEGSETITNATYTWSWWDDTLNSGKGGYKNIVSNVTDPILTINQSDTYAFASLKCTMTYNGKTYEDYVVLTSETVIYTTVVKFFDGSNIFHADDLYIVAYLELYQNNHKIESALDAADTYCTGVSTVSSGVITANISGSFNNGDKMYFVQKSSGLYNVILGEYQSGQWKKINYTPQYKYTNNLYPSKQANIIAISKESINKSKNIDFIIYDKHDVELSRTNVNIIDSNDPVVGTNAPTNPVPNQLWLDTSTTPHVLKIYNSDENTWLECSEKIGGAVFTSKPSSGYSKGDLWILADGETCGEFGPGSMLKATTTSPTFNANHWIDADAEATELKNNIKQYFTFDPDTGLRVGQSDDKFYVNISSTEMGFYDNQKGQHQRVVKISNNSATIQNAKLKGNTEFYGQINICDPTSEPEDNVDDALFVLKIESNGSLSLAVAN